MRTLNYSEIYNISGGKCQYAPRYEPSIHYVIPSIDSSGIISDRIILAVGNPSGTIHFRDDSYFGANQGMVALSALKQINDKWLVGGTVKCGE